MQLSRRRKKRPNYNIRTIEICRGKNGFGFTISGQQPCILSCIVQNSPAEQAGLRQGNYLISVCGQNVSKVPHDDVVQLIGNCHGILELQIAENYYSDSSEEDFVTTARQKPKFPNKCKTNGHSTHPLPYSKPYKGIHNSSEGYALRDRSCSSRFADINEFAGKKADSFSSQQYSDQENAELPKEGNTIYQCLVGYLGTIEMPKKLTPVSRQQIIQGCIKRLRAEKRNYTPVMMTVFPCSIRLRNDIGTTIAVYPGGRVTFCSASSEHNRKYFGIVTTSVSEEPSNSCHVFVTLNPAHQEHAKIASKFGVNCASTDDHMECSHFPAISDPLVNAIRKYYEAVNNGNDIDEPLVANSPQPSNDSSVTASNSDSGIGFKDDSGHQSDRILVVDIQNQRLHIQAVGQPNPHYIDCYTEKSDSRNSTVVNSTTSVSTANERLTRSYQTDSRENLFSWNTRSLHSSSSANRFLHKSCDNGLSELCTSAEASLERRLSPKVFTNMSDVMPVSQSMEDLKTQNQYEDLEPIDAFMKKRSLQDLTSFTAEQNTPEKSLQCDQSESERKVTSWAASLEKLLFDTVGLHAFAEFLRKEFSIENAYFWAACEKYRRTSDVDERKKLALDIYDKFLSNTAAEPVNVDSSGKNFTQQQLHSGDINLLSNAQKQIFNLMKFDSYPRFLKSDIYKNYLMREISGESITLQQDAVDSDLLITPNVANVKEQPHEDSTTGTVAERSQRASRRRRSLLLWTRSRCKSRDRAAPHNENVSSCSSSRTSLASWDLAVPVSLCRVILPDASSAVLNIQPQQSVHYLISKLLEKRAVPYNSFQVIFTADDKVVDLEENASVLSGKEVRVEWRIEFRLDLPDRKSLTIKSKPSHTLGAVLGPVLMKHGYNLQMVTLCLISENEVLEPSVLVSTVDKQRIQVLTRSTPTPNLQGWNVYGAGIKPKQSSTLDEITNRVFEELLQGKAENYRNPVAEIAPSVHSEDWSSEHSSKILDKFLRKDSFHQDKHRKSKKCSEAQNNTEKKSTNSRLPPVIAKWKPGLKLDAKFEKDGLYEGLKRCQRGRLEDQRGTEINIELPDFLKDKENTPSGRKKLKKNRKDGFIEPKICTSNEAIKKTETNETEYACGKISDAYQISSNCERDNEVEDNVYANNAVNFTTGKLEASISSPFKEPPPLPPKPKNISWRISGAMNSYNFDKNEKSVYLDQPTSSFV